MAPAVKVFLPIGHRSGALTVTGEAVKSSTGYRVYPVLCDCGTQRWMRVDWVKEGRVRSCGCQHRENLGKANTTHGMSRTPEYRAWCAMKNRCYDPNDSQFHNYGARGIRVCDEWVNSFDAFFAHMGPRPSADHSLEREENEKGYGPDNCRWATAIEQSRNRRVSVRVVFRGREAPLAEHCELVGLPYNLVYQRVFRYGLTPEAALSRPNLGRGLVRSR